MKLENLERQQEAIRFPLMGMGLFLCAAIIYALVFIPVYPVMGVTIVLFEFIIIAAGGWAFGIGVGVFAGLLLAITGALLSYHFGETYKWQSDALVLVFGVGIGALTGWLGSVQRKVKKQREEAKDALRLKDFAVASSISAIAITNLYGKLTYVNRSFLKMYGYKEDKEVLAKAAIEFWESPEQAVAMANVLREKGDWIGDMVGRKKDGTLFDVQLTAHLVKNDKGDPISTMSSFLDNAERRMMEDQLEQARKMESIGQLAAGVAHEINTPAQYVSDNTHFLEDSFEDIDQILEKYGELLKRIKSGDITDKQIQEIETAVEKADIEYLREEIPNAIRQSLEGLSRVTKIVRAMKEFSHPGTKEKTPIDINKAIQSTITVARNEWKYSADIETDFDDTLPLVPCLPGEFNQVILNMITNAVHSIADKVDENSEEKGTIRISTHLDSDWAEVRISDTGMGIPEEIRARIFDPFFTTKEVGKGTGQGLNIAFSVISKKHGGTINIDTETGKGATFIIRLPIKNRPE